MMKPVFFLILLSLFSCRKSNNNDDNNSYSSKEIQYKNISGVDSNLLSLDIYHYSDNKTRPIIIWIHGGGWAIGDKRNSLENKKSLFNSLGYVFVSINYRLSPFPYEVNNPNRIKFPIHNIDIADAIKWVYDNIENYGGDKNRIILLGHSAGAQLVALTGTNLSFLQQAGVPINSIKGIAVIDTQAYDIYELIRSNASNMYKNAFGTDQNENISASAIRNISPNTHYPNFFIAKRGDSARISKANQFIQTLQNNNIYVEQVDGSIYTHGEINEAIGKKNENVITPVLKHFFEYCLNTQN